MYLYYSYQTLNQVALEKSLSQEVVYFYLLDALAREGSGCGWIEEQNFIELIKIHHRSSTATIKKYLKSGNNIFWRLENNRIWKYSLKKVLKCLEVKKYTVRYQKRPLKELLTPKKTLRKAYLHRAVLEMASLEKHLSSRTTLAKRCSITKQTSCHYTAMTKGKIKKQFREIRPVERTGLHEEIHLTAVFDPTCQIKKTKKQYQKIKQLPNQYKGYEVYTTNRLERCNQINTNAQTENKKTVSTTQQTDFSSLQRKTIPVPSPLHKKPNTPLY